MPIIALTGGSGWHIQDLLRAGVKTGLTVEPGHWAAVCSRPLSDVANTTNETHTGVFVGTRPVTPDDSVLLRTMPHGSLEQIITRMNLMHRLTQHSVKVMNHPRAVEIAIDKFLTLQTLATANVAILPDGVAQRADEAKLLFEALGGDVVVKPLFGSEGFGVMRVSDPDIADRVFDTLEKLGQVIYLQKFEDHGDEDFRVFVIAGKVKAAMRRTGKGDWRSNVARGGTGESIPVDESTNHVHGLPNLGPMSIKAAAACGLDVTGVDILVSKKTGKPHVIEVNGVPGWRELARVTNIDIASEVLLSLASKKVGPLTPHPANFTNQ